MMVLFDRNLTGSRVSDTPLEGAYVVSPNRRVNEDPPGTSFMHLFWNREPHRTREQERKRLMYNVENVSFSHSAQKHTLWGMRYEVSPYSQAKLIVGVRGAAQYIILDLRPDSPTFKNHFSFYLRSQGDMIYAPRGFAHGYLSLTENCDILYLNEEFYGPGGERGICYDDPQFDLPWESAPAVISEKDKNWPAFSPDTHLEGMEGLYP